MNNLQHQTITEEQVTERTFEREVSPNGTVRTVESVVTSHIRTTESTYAPSLTGTYSNRSPSWAHASADDILRDISNAHRAMQGRALPPFVAALLTR